MQVIERRHAGPMSMLSDRLHAWAKGWVILLLVVLLAALATLTLPAAKRASGGLALDSEFFYTPEEAFSTLSSYSEAGRAWIVTYYLTGDILTPILYALIFSLLVSWLLRRGFRSEAGVMRFNVIPVGAALFDVLENVCFVSLLTALPSQPRAVAWIAACCTMTKALFLYATFVLLLFALAKAALNRFGKGDPQC